MAKDIAKEVRDNQAIYKLATDKGINIAQARQEYFGQNNALTDAAAEVTKASPPKSTTGTGSPKLTNLNPYTVNDLSVYDQALPATSQQIILNGKNTYNRGYITGNQALMDAGRYAAEMERSKYGYSGGDDGSQHISRMDNYGDFSFRSAPPTFYDKYGDEADELMRKLRNRKEFSYNPEEDPLYDVYRAQYNREGNRAMKNTLGEVSARTGGMASSYATSAAMQANQYYAQQLADRIPELQQLAYSMYMNDLNMDRQDLAMLQDASDRSYAKYRDTVGDWYKDRDFAYGVHRDDVDDEQWQTTYDRGVLESDRSFEETQRMNNFGINSQAQGNAQERIYNMIVNGGLTAEEVKAQAPELLEVSGLTALDLAAYETTRREALAAQQAKSNGSGKKETDKYVLSFDDAESMYTHDEGPVLSEKAIEAYYNWGMVSEQEVKNMMDELEAGRTHYSRKTGKEVTAPSNLWNIAWQ